MKLHFIGTGGGRRTLTNQTRKTAGTIVESEKASIYIDPGPGSIVHSQDKNKEKLKGLIVTHSHLDHYGDAEAIIEQISYKYNNSCKLMAPVTVIDGYGEYKPAISDYHQNLCTDVVNLTDKDTELDDLEIESQEMFHNEPKCRGLKISDGEEKIGFWTDTRYSEELLEFYEECDILVINCAKPHNEKSRNHTSMQDIPKILGNSEASTAIITHFNSKFLEADMAEEENWLKERVSQKVIFAQDGMTFPGDRKLSSF